MPGAKVVVGALGLEGIVESVHDRHVEVQVRGKRLRASLDEVRAIAAAPGAAGTRRCLFDRGFVAIILEGGTSSKMAGSAGRIAITSSGGEAAISPGGSGNRPRVTVNVMADAPEGGLHDLNVIGCTVPEAIERADKFLDQALLAEMREIRLIHGHGTGQLRRALAEFLSDHPLVQSFALAAAQSGRRRRDRGRVEGLTKD